MRRRWLIVVALLAALALVLSTGCRKHYYRDTPEEGEPAPSPTPPTPGN